MDEDSDYDISIDEGDWPDAAVASLLRQAIQAALGRHEVSQAQVEVCLVSDDHIAKLNEQYLGHTGPTDVLTFDLGSDFDAESSGASPIASDKGASGDESCRASVEGQIVVSFETAQREALERGHSASAELALYVVHGVLHLLGYDDHGEAESQRMHAMEDELLTAIGIGPVFGSLSATQVE